MLSMKLYRSQVSLKRKTRGALLLDVLLAVFILSLAAISFYGLTPVIFRSRTMAKDNTAALQMANRLVEHIQLLKASDLKAPTLTALNLIDAGQSQQPYSFTHIPLDEASRYSPAQTLRNGTGSLTFTDLDSGAIRVNVQINWTSASGKASSVTTGTIIGGYR